MGRRGENALGEIAVRVRIWRAAPSPLSARRRTGDNLGERRIKCTGVPQLVESGVCRTLVSCNLTAVMLLACPVAS
ncbi:MAG: hypothetical protein SYC29_04380 [Planctomycetota bacterium]|nr:hypothetical protein [Planctomycetota bacterium]